MGLLKLDYKWDINKIKRNYDEIVDKLKFCSESEKDYLSMCLDCYTALVSEFYDMSLSDSKEMAWGGGYFTL